MGDQGDVDKAFGRAAQDGDFVAGLLPWAGISFTEKLSFSQAC